MARSKQKQQRHRARQVKRAAKRKAKRAAIRSQLPARKTQLDLPGLKKFVEETQVFWLVHGINFLASDYDEGLWRPVFPSVYDGEEVDPEDIARRVMTHFSDQLDDDGWNIGKMVVAWSVQNSGTLFTYYQTALRLVRDADPEVDAEQVVRLPHNGVVWRLFEDLKADVRRNQERT